MAAVDEEDILAQQGPQAGAWRQLHPVVHVWDLRRAVLVQLGRAAKVLRDVLDEAAAQGHIEDLLATADAEDGQVPRPGRLDERDLAVVALGIHLGLRMERFCRVPVAGVDIIAPREQQACRCGQFRPGIAGCHQEDGPRPAGGPEGGEVMLLRARLGFTAHQEH